MQHPLFSWANQFRAVVPAAALALGLVAAPATALPQPAEMSAPAAVHTTAPTEHACPADWAVNGVHNSEPLLLALAGSPRPRDWTALLAPAPTPAPLAVQMAAILAGDNPRPNYFIAAPTHPARGPVVAQSAEAPASAANNAPVGDHRPATLGDLKDTENKLSADNRDIRAEIRETRRELVAENQEIRRLIEAQNQRFQASMDAFWTAFVTGFIAIFGAIIGLFLYLPTMLRELLRELKAAPAPAQPQAVPAGQAESAEPSPQAARRAPDFAARFAGMKPAIAIVLFVAGVAVGGGAFAIAQ